ncbi:FAD:protein FMN transferase [Bacteroidia bacterium]|nr:FAD:protein FMN transferase [Bacteroidia bacterium]GHV45480.1 FAD:protein FMN transferase [Bacteroidia bacterium]
MNTAQKNIIFVVIAVVLLAVALFVFNKITPQSKKIQFLGETQGTYYAVTYFDGKNRDFQREIDSILKNFDQVASLWEENSEISKVNRNEDLELSDMFIDIFNKSEEISKMSGATFDITVGNLVKMYGFWNKQREELTEEKINHHLQFVGYQKVKIENRRMVKESDSIKLDFNAIAQGYSVDVLCGFLESKGIKNYLVDIGGEVKGRGNKSHSISFQNCDAWIVGIEKPSETADDNRTVQLKVALKDASIVTSGSYRKYFEKEGRRFSHTIDPKTGKPISHNLLSVSVLAKDAWYADALATVFMVMGVEKSQETIQQLPDVEACFISAEGEGFKIEFSAGFTDYLTTCQ